MMLYRSFLLWSKLRVHGLRFSTDYRDLKMADNPTVSPLPFHISGPGMVFRCPIQECTIVHAHLFTHLVLHESHPLDTELCSGRDLTIYSKALLSCLQSCSNVSMISCNCIADKTKRCRMAVGQLLSGPVIYTFPCWTQANSLVFLLLSGWKQGNEGERRD